ncbi:histidine kinase [Xylanibacillus composti]|uniref:Histidine kinase n=1 Tax=Xylanibacillus composti TaxID=1572762 RepID=A0A8J4H4T6_9BACL|nr:sensor histidine kinase [Xylanibacillus composti]GIQ69626.1 histidine kinase [Xylanibacillus composti]
MFARMNTFTKITVIIVMLLVPILAVYIYSNQTSIRVVEEQLIQSNFNRLSFFLRQMDNISEQIWRSSYLMLEDPDAIRMQNQAMDNRTLVSLLSRQAVVEDLEKLRTSLPWDVELTIYAPETELVVTTTRKRDYDFSYFESNYSLQWSYRLLNLNGENEAYMVRHMTKPFAMEMNQEAMGLILEVAVPEREIANLLEQLRADGPGEPIFYHMDYGAVGSPSAKAEQLASYEELLRTVVLQDQGHEIVEIGRIAYLMNYARSETLNWYLIDMIPLESIMQPIEHTMLLFYLTVALLLCIGLVCASLLYRNVQMPIHRLTRGVQRLRRGEYAFRLTGKIPDEFAYLFSEFNVMSSEIQTLIEKVYVEQINVRKAKLRQLQAQINPHFLYNNFNFIQSMAQMDNKEAVIAFTQHLSHYYRYTTRMGDGLTTLREELSLVQSYLEIHKMQMERLAYDVDVDEALMSASFPPLLLQPVVENAVVHGIENRLGDGYIRIRGEQTAQGFQLIVEDNGKGMTPMELRRQSQQLLQDSMEEEGCGLRNVHQRLQHMFDPRSGLALAESPFGGLRVTLQVVLPKE